MINELFVIQVLDSVLFEARNVTLYTLSSTCIAYNGDSDITIRQFDRTPFEGCIGPFHLKMSFVLTAPVTF